jgi:WD40 repeat protein
VSGGADKNINVWSIEEKTCLAHIVAHNECIKSVRFSPTDKGIVSTGWDYNLNVYGEIE